MTFTSWLFVSHVWLHLGHLVVAGVVGFSFVVVFGCCLLYLSFCSKSLYVYYCYYCYLWFVNLGCKDIEIDEMVSILRELSSKADNVGYPELRRIFVRRMGLISRCAFDYWVVFCISNGWLEPIGSIRETGGRLEYLILRDSLPSLRDKVVCDSLPNALEVESSGKVSVECILKGLNERVSWLSEGVAIKEPIKKRVRYVSSYYSHHGRK